MCTNRWQIQMRFNQTQSSSKLEAIEVNHCLVTYLNKCNYREYIREIEKWLQSPLIGSCWTSPSKGSANLEIKLGIEFLNLLDFLKSYYLLNTPLEARWYRSLRRKVKYLVTYLTFKPHFSLGLTYG